MGGARILVVEDNPLNRRLVQAILVHRGHEVLEATTVDEGLAAARARPPDVAVIDIQLPGGGGERLLREIRATPALARLPCVAVTAFAMHGDRERLLAAGFDAYVSKPIDTAAFGPLVESFLPGRGRDPVEP